MHPNPAFRNPSRTSNLAFAQARGFGQLSVNGGFGPLAAHLPFVLDEDEGGDGAAYLHLTRSNPIVAALDQPLPALLSVSGPDGYVSPDWYGLSDQVPTWNYVAVHLRGPLERLAEDRLREVLDRLSARFESELAPKAPWTSAKMHPEALARTMRAVVPVRLRIEDVAGTWKLSQNKPDAARLGAAAAVEVTSGQERAALAALMRDLPREPHEDLDR